MTEEDKNLLANFRTLGAENRRLREALEEIKSMTASTNFHPVCMRVSKTATKALFNVPKSENGS